MNGPVIFSLAEKAFTHAVGRLAFNLADVDDLKAGNLYINVYSTDNPNGFARAQLRLPQSDCAVAAAPAPLAAASSASPAVAVRISPPRTGDAGLASVSSVSVH